MKTPKILIAAIIVVIVVAIVFIAPTGGKLAPKPVVFNFETCKAAGGIILETYPVQCQSGERRFTQDIGNELELKDLITIQNPRPNQTITSPIEIRGAARGAWFFEASFPIKLVDDKGKIIVESHAEATEEWMTEKFVPYKADLEFKTEARRGTLILMKDNPSGLPENDKQLEIPVVFR